MASDIENYQALYEYIDADAEFQLRKIEPPRDTVKADTEKLIAAIPSKAEDQKAGQKCAKLLAVLSQTEKTRLTISAPPTRGL